MIVQTAMPSSRAARSGLPNRDARPLYIAPPGDTRVALDGPALSVCQEEKAEQLFPLRRLSRIYTGDWVSWTSEALIACAATGVTVVFVDGGGEVVARVLGRPGQRDELFHRWTEFLLLPQAGGMYGFWRDDLGRRAAWWAGVKLGAPPNGRGPHPCREWINREAARYAGRAAGERSRQWLRSLAFAWMQGHLQDLGFGTATELAQAGEPALARDLAGILMWYLEPARIGWLKRRHLAAKRKGQAVTPPRRRDVVRLFESRATRSGVRGREITSLLHRWLIHNG
jgi:hypothetical protein